MINENYKMSVKLCKVKREVLPRGAAACGRSSSLFLPGRPNYCLRSFNFNNDLQKNSEVNNAKKKLFKSER